MEGNGEDARGTGAPVGDGGMTAAVRSTVSAPATIPPVHPARRVYAALDLGTNNCRLLIARPARRGFNVIDAFSRIIRLGEGVAATGRLSDAAMIRTLEALKVCSTKMARHRVDRARLVATEACRIAENGPRYLERVKRETGLELEILSRHDEAMLALSGCAPLIDPHCDHALVFDIGGGSTELVWLDLRRADRSGTPRGGALDARDNLAGWTSLPVGVVNLADRFGGRTVTPPVFEAMVDEVSALLAPFEAQHGFNGRIAGSRVHLLGTSGTVTTLAGMMLKLPRYERSRVDGCWMAMDEVRRLTYQLVACSYDERVAEPCIGRDRAELVLAGCAILEAIVRLWPAPRMRVADRGLREGILASLMQEDLARHEAGIPARTASENA